jgi:GMP synthase-like glutamine amidotransferase
MTSALIVQHEEATPPGLLGDWLAQYNAEVKVHRIDVEERTPDVGHYDIVVLLGSELPAFDDSVPFIPRETELILRAVELDVPMLGLCFGGQLMARTLGGMSYRAARSEIGWFRVRSKDPKLIPEGPWFEWHHDSFTVPPGGKLIAETDVGPQAYVIGRNLGLQFHPEVTPEIIEGWVRAYRDGPHDDGLDLDAMLDETNQRSAAASRMTKRLFDRFLSKVALIRPYPPPASPRP